MMNQGYGGRQTDLQEMFRLKMAQALAQQAQGGPVYSPGQGIAKLLAGALAGQQMGSAMGDIDARQQQATDERSAAFTKMIPDEGVAGPRMGTGRAPQSMDIAKALAGSADPGNASLGMDLYTKGLDREQSNTDWQNRFQMQNSAQDARFNRQMESSEADRAAARDLQKELAGQSRANQLAMAQIAAGSKPPQVTWTPDPSNPGRQVSSTGEAKAMPQSQAEQDLQKRGQTARTTLDLLDTIGSPRKGPDGKDLPALIDAATGSGLGAIADATQGFFGGSNPGAEAAQQLKMIQGQLVMMMPRMEGPQSNLDQQLYREMAGEIGDPSVPAPRKRAAVDMLRQLNQKYAGGAPTPAPAAPAGATGASKRLRFNPETGELE
jgi:hypothetical protein